MSFSSHTLMNWDGGQGLFQAKSSTSPGVLSRNWSRPLEQRHENSASSEQDSVFQFVHASSQRYQVGGTEAEVESGTIAASKTTSSSIFASYQESSSLRSPSPALDSASLFGDSPSPETPMKSLPPLHPQLQQPTKKSRGIQKEKFEPNSYEGTGTGTGIFLSHVFVPPLPRDSTFAHYLKPHPRALSRITRSSTPSILFEDSPTPSSSRTYSQSNSISEPRHKYHTLLPSFSTHVQPRPSLSSSSKAPTKYTSLEDALNASTTHNVADDYFKADIRSPLPTIPRKKKKREILDSVQPSSSKNPGSSPHRTTVPPQASVLILSKPVAPKQKPEFKRSSLPRTTVSHQDSISTLSAFVAPKQMPETKRSSPPRTTVPPQDSISTLSTPVAPKQKPATKSAPKKYTPGDILSTSPDDDCIRLFVGTHGDFARTGWTTNERKTYPNSATSPKSLHRKPRDPQMSSVLDSNTRHLEMNIQQRNQQADRGARRGFPTGLNSCSIGFGADSRKGKGKERASEGTVWAERMFESILTSETSSGLWCVQTSDDEDVSKNETDSHAHDGPLDTNPTEFHNMQTSSSHPPAESISTTAGPSPMSTMTAESTVSQGSLPSTSASTARPKSSTRGRPRKALARSIQFVHRTSEDGLAPSLPKAIKAKKSRSTSASRSTVQNPYPYILPLGPSAPSFPNPSHSMPMANYTPASLSLPTPTPSSSFPPSLPAQPLQESSSRSGSEIHANPSGPSEKALGKRKAVESEDAHIAAKPQPKRVRPANPRASTTSAIHSATHYPGHIPVVTNSVIGIPPAVQPSPAPQTSQSYGYPPVHWVIASQAPAQASGPAIPAPATIANAADGRSTQPPVIPQTSQIGLVPHSNDLAVLMNRLWEVQKTNPQAVTVLFKLLEGQQSTSRALDGILPASPSLAYTDNPTKSVSANSNFPHMEPQPTLNHDTNTTQDAMNSNVPIEDVHKGVDVGDWLVAGLSTGEGNNGAVDDVGVNIGPSLFDHSSSPRSGTVTAFRDASRLFNQNGQDHTITSMTSEISTINPSVFLAEDPLSPANKGVQPSLVFGMPEPSEEVYYSGDALPPRGKQRVISVLPKDPKRPKSKGPTNNAASSSHRARSPLSKPRNDALSLVLEYNSNSNTDSDDDPDGLDVGVPVQSDLFPELAPIVPPSPTESTRSHEQQMQSAMIPDADVISIESDSGLQAKDGSKPKPLIKSRMKNTRLSPSSISISDSTQSVSPLIPNLEPSEEKEVGDTLSIARSRPVKRSSTVRSAVLVSDEDGPSVGDHIKKKTKKKPKPSRKVAWPKGSGSYFCHQCRRTSNKLHAFCSKCGVNYCNMCITVKCANYSLLTASPHFLITCPFSPGILMSSRSRTLAKDFFVSAAKEVVVAINVVVNEGKPIYQSELDVNFRALPQVEQMDPPQSRSLEAALISTKSPS
ncbi:hypothetical protein F5880DRAFT_1609061 [Lentinula raphanica]|nr:hypothetical protein F5880DRAFT_1609061 [Lentinula raphanica]